VTLSSSYVLGTTSGFTHVSVPISTLNPNNVPVHEFRLMKNSSTSSSTPKLWVDEVRFTGSADDPPPDPTPSPSPSPSGDPVILTAGDIACDPGDSNYNSGQGSASACEMLATSKLLTQGNPTTVLSLGDHQYDDATLAKFKASYDPTWGQVKNVTRPIPGNHEYDDFENSQPAYGYFTYFGSAAGDPAKGYYSFNLANNWHVIVLNGECSEVGGCGAGSPQEEWLRNDLAANTGKHILAAWHEPRFSSGPVSDNFTFDAFWRDLYAANADLILNGHDHVYERYTQMDPNGQADSSGIREFVVGTGGADHVNFITSKPATEQVRDNTTFGVLKLTLRASSYDWEFIPATQSGNGTFTDSGSQATHS
jgi:hypothetical protein